MKLFAPARAVYTIAVCFLGLFLFAFFWFILWTAITQISTAVTASMQQYSATPTYSAFEYASQFMNNLWHYLLAIAVFGLLLWAVIYSQRKNVEAMYS